MTDQKENGKTYNLGGLIIISLLIILILLDGSLTFFISRGPGDFGIRMTLIAIVIFFGILILGAKNKDDNILNVDYIRLAISATLIIEFFVFFGAAVFVAEKDSSISEELVKTLGIILGIVITFYFTVEKTKDILVEKYKWKAKNKK